MLHSCKYEHMLLQPGGNAAFLTQQDRSHKVKGFLHNLMHLCIHLNYVFAQPLCYLILKQKY